MILLHQSFGMPYRPSTFLLPDVELRVRPRPRHHVRTLLVSYHQLSGWLACPIDLASFSAYGQFVTPPTCGPFWRIPEDEMHPFVRLLTSAKGRKVHNHTFWFLSQVPSAALAFLFFLFWKACSVPYATFFFWRSILCVARLGSTTCRTTRLGAAHCLLHMPNIHRFHRSHSRPLPFFPS